MKTEARESRRPGFLLGGSGCLRCRGGKYSGPSPWQKEDRWTTCLSVFLSLYSHPITYECGLLRNSEHNEAPYAFHVLLYLGTQEGLTIRQGHRRAMYSGGLMLDSVTTPSLGGSPKSPCICEKGHSIRRSESQMRLVCSEQHPKRYVRPWKSCITLPLIWHLKGVPVRYSQHGFLLC